MTTTLIPVIKSLLHGLDGKLTQGVVTEEVTRVLVSGSAQTGLSEDPRT